MQKTRLFVLISAMFFAGCSGGGSGGGGSFLNNPDKTKQLTHGIATVQGVMNSRTNSARPFFAAISGATESTPQPYNLEKSKQKFLNKINGSNCEWVLPPINPKAQQGPLDLEPFRIELKGSLCPINAVIDVQFTQINEEFSGQFQMKFTIFDAELQQESQLKSFELSGKISGAAKQSADKVAMQMSSALSGGGVFLAGDAFKTQMNTTMAMEIIPPKQGGPAGFSAPNVLPITFSASMEQGYQFAEGEVRLRAVASVNQQGQVQEAYFVNNRSVSQEEFAKYVSEFSLPGMGPGNGSEDSAPGGPPGNGDTLMACSLRGYDARQIAVGELFKPEDQITVLPVTDINSCNRSVRREDFFNGRYYSLSITHEMGYVSGRVVNEQGVATGRDIVVPEESRAVFSSDQHLHFVFSCRPVASCP